MTARAGARCGIGAAMLVLAAAGVAHAAEPPRFERVLFLPAPGRMSIVLEMSGAPDAVTSRRISADLLEIDATPVAVDRPRAVTAPASWRGPFKSAGASALVTTVLIDGTTGAGAAATLRARITVRDTSGGMVRVQGTRVYVDISSGEGSAAAAPRQAAASVPPTRRVRPPTPTPQIATAADGAGEASVQSAMKRFGELLPFVTSAADAPSGPVLAALAAPLSELEKSVRAIDVPPARQPAVRLLLSALESAAKAIDPAYGGDRVEQVRQAAVFFQQATAER